MNKCYVFDSFLQLSSLYLVVQLVWRTDYILGRIYAEILKSQKGSQYLKQYFICLGCLLHSSPQPFFHPFIHFTMLIKLLQTQPILTLMAETLWKEEESGKKWSQVKEMLGQKKYHHFDFNNHYL